MSTVAVATFDAEMRLTVHTDAFDHGVTSLELAEIFGLTSGELLGALAFEENTGFCGQFYEAIYESYGPAYGTTDSSGSVIDVSLALPSDSTQPGQVSTLLELNVATGGEVEPPARGSFGPAVH